MYQVPLDSSSCSKKWDLLRDREPILPFRCLNLGQPDGKISVLISNTIPLAAPRVWNPVHAITPNNNMTYWNYHKEESLKQLSALAPKIWYCFVCGNQQMVGNGWHNHNGNLPLHLLQINFSHPPHFHQSWGKIHLWANFSTQRNCSTVDISNRCFLSATDYHGTDCHWLAYMLYVGQDGIPESTWAPLCGANN